MTQALQKISDEEAEQLKQESTQKIDLMNRDVLQWPTRPIMSDCCGEKEALGLYQIWELKDAYDDDELKCESYTTPEQYLAKYGEPAPSQVSCSNCANAVTGTGEATRLAAMAVAAETRMHRTLPGTFEGGSGGTASDNFEQTQESDAEAGKALEIAQAWRSRGRLLKRPRFLRHCSAYSAKDTFAVCVVFNQLGNCPKFVATSAPDSADAAAVQMSESEPGTGAAVVGAVGRGLRALAAGLAEQAVTPATPTTPAAGAVGRGLRALAAGLAEQAVTPAASTPPPTPPAQAVLHGPMDAANCGDFSFSLYTAQLIVSMLGTGGAIGGEYDVPTLPIHVWTQLVGRDGQPLPVLVYREHEAIALQVGNIGLHNGPTATPTR